MSIYLIPPVADAAEILEITKKAGVPFEVFNSLRELILKSHQVPIIIGTIQPKDLLVLNRYSQTLLEELPTAVMSVPGALYTGEWVSLASALPPIDWKEIQSKLAKSGHLATTHEQLEKRELGAAVYAPATRLRPGARHEQEAIASPADNADDDDFPDPAV